MLGMTFDAARRRHGWGAVLDFARHLPQSSATWRALNPDEAEFASPLHVAAMAADLYDELASTKFVIQRLFSSNPPSRAPKPYPRPGAQGSGGGGERHFGKGAIPIRDFDAWYYGMRNQATE